MLELPAPEEDGLLIPEVGEWSTDKHYFLRRYIDAFTTAMKNKSWEGLHYIDLFAGAGIERVRETGRLEWGSPLIAAQAKHPFTGLHICELDRKKSEALSNRVMRYHENVQSLCEDAYAAIDEIVARIPGGTLSLAFLDPFGLHLDYTTLVTLARRRSDLIIFFPDHLDALRNWEKYYFENPDSNLDRCLGQGADWRRILSECNPDSRAAKLRELYVSQLKKLGYREFEYERIFMKSHPMHILIFCSQHRVAARIWRGIAVLTCHANVQLPPREDSIAPPDSARPPVRQAVPVAHVEVSGRNGPS